MSQITESPINSGRFSGSGTTISDASISGFTLGTGITVKNSQTPTIDGASITNCKYGVEYEDSSAGTLEGSTIYEGTGTSSYGVRTDDSSTPAISDATELDDHKYGLYCAGTSEPTMRGSIVVDCGYGIYTKASARPNLGETSSDKGDNSITNSTSYHVYSPARFNTVYAEYNWWGTSTPPASKFSSNVDYSPHLTSNPFSLYTPPTYLDQDARLGKPVTSVGPNPVRSSAMFRVTGLGSGQSGSVAIYDVQGRLVRTLHIQSETAEWDTFDSSGHPVAPGIYLYRVLAGSYESTGRITVIR